MEPIARTVSEVSVTQTVHLGSSAEAFIGKA
jgi:hypothetical protein